MGGFLKPMEITKSSGEKEAFSKDKFCLSIERAGAPHDLVENVCALVEKELKPDISTTEIFRHASQYLLKKNLAVGMRYNIRKGMMELGPAGFRFEQFVEALMKILGYETERDVIIQGQCVSHEVDVAAHKGDQHYLMEMKYHNDWGTKTGIETVMYAYARFLDIAPLEGRREQYSKLHSLWLVTNAKFTTKAIEYGKCQKLTMTGWNYPESNLNLESLIRDNAAYPVTILPSVDRFAREAFARYNMILAQDLLPYSGERLVKEFNIEEKKALRIIEEARLLVSTP